MTNQKTSHNPPRFLLNLFAMFSEEMEGDPEAVKQFLEQNGIDVEELQRKGKELIDDLKTRYQSLPSRSNGNHQTYPPSPERSCVTTDGNDKPIESFSFWERIKYRIHRKITRVCQFFLRIKVSGVSQARVFLTRTGRIFFDSPGTVLLLIGFMVILLPFYFFGFRYYGFGTLSGIFLTIGLFLSFCLVGGLLAYKLLRHLPPEEYARILIDGYPIPATLQLVSNEIRKMAASFVDHTDARFLQQLGTNILKLKEWEDARQTIQQQEKKIRSRVERLCWFIENQYPVIQRVLALKRYAAKQLGIPERRMCDYIFQFSPTIYHNRVLKMVANWKEVLDIYPSVDLSPSLEVRIRALFRENQRIMRKIKRRLQYQYDILEYTDLHYFMHRFVTDVSISGALKEYTRAISYLARGALSELENFPTHSKKHLHSILERLNKRLGFIYFKQRARGGFDIHYSCYRLCRVYSSERFYIQKQLETQAAILKKIIDNPQGDFITADYGTAITQLQALSTLFDTVTMVLEKCRDDIIEKFKSFYGDWIQSLPGEDEEQPRLIITHSYSRTVREVLKRVVLADPPESHPFHSPNRPKLFILKPQGEDDLKARLMMYDLKEEGHPQDLKNTFPGVDKLMKQTKIMIILGAECYDKDRWVFHPQGVSDYLKTLKSVTSENGMELTVVVIAESYKAYHRLVELPEYYQDRFDNISLYEPDLIDVIISDKEIITRKDLTDSTKIYNLMLSTMLPAMRTY